MRLVLIALLVLTLAGAASAADLTKDQATGDLQFRSSHFCTGAYDSNAFYQYAIYAYGNALSVGTGGPLTTLDFVHNGYGFAGPYNYTLWVYDEATCTVVGSIPGLVAPDAAAGSIQTLVDLCPYDLAVSGDIIVAIQGQSCYNATDCYPDVEFDYAPNPVDGCGMRIEVGVPNTCVQILSTNGVVDFLLGVVVDECAPPPVTGACCVPGALCQVLTQTDCLAQGGVYLHDGPCLPTDCVPTPVETVNWGAIKALYR